MDQELAERGWSDGHWASDDGLTLHYRDYPGDEAAIPVLCLHGLTRTCRDYEALAPYLQSLPAAHRVIVPDLRGHGASEYARDHASYSLDNFTRDIAALIAALGLRRLAVIGTSLGGVITMRLAAMHGASGDGAEIARAEIAGAAINDIGPEIETSGLARISANAGLVRSYPTWMHAARALMESHQHSFPDYDIQRWITLAKRNMIVAQNGRIMPDYDLDVAQPLQANAAEGAATPDLWPDYLALARAPLLVIRGELSDILSVPTYEAMIARAAGKAEGVSIAGAGHTPALDEALALAAIDSLLARITPA